MEHSAHEPPQKHREHDSCCKPKSAVPRPWYRKPLFFWVIVTAILYGASVAVPSLHAFRHSFEDYAAKMLWPIFLGFLFGGLIDYYVPQQYISKYLTAKRKRTVLYATGLGFLMSACSHGIIALSMELHKKGASNPAVVSFLLASPWANLPITFLLVGFFGWKGILIIVLSLAVALNTGLIFQWLDHRNLIEKTRHAVEVDENFSIVKDIQRRFRDYRFSGPGLLRDARGIAKGMSELSDMVLLWVLIGILLASVAGAFVPETIFQKYFGPSLVGLLVTLVAATVLEVCSEGTSPLAFEIYRQTGALGNAFAFLMGGVVTDYTEIALVWSNLGRRTALWMLGITLPQVFILAWILNLLF
jgi:uncharacterized membrane protein YraQ (UPF0718 family)